MKWFSRPPVWVIDWAKHGMVQQVTSLEAAAVELLKWPKSAKRDRAALMLADVLEGKGSVLAAKRAFEAAAKAAKVWVPYRGP